MNKDFIKTAIKTIKTELKEIKSLESQINQSFNEVCELLINISGKVILMGMGKSGHIANKIAATLASTGTPAFFIHPSEAGHGDLGMITKEDIVIVISYSGESDEIATLIPVLKNNNIKIISLTGNKKSTLAQVSNVNLDISVEKEACPHNLAPTSSTTKTLVLGDAIAIAILNQRKFTANDFAQSHPSGKLGRRLITRISDIMHTGNELPIVKENTPLKDSIIQMSSKKLGLLLITDTKNKLLGIFTDGDLRRVFEKKHNIENLKMRDVMVVSNYSTIKNALATEVLDFMNKKQISNLPVLDNNNCVIGAINMHDLLKARI
ncbi:Arabinose 5-phosphate isomerase [hydrothermal vent metagenome]|uniref:Arabinose 5-phosphate isomerase n=1 Tax=hydrothermal vent metagenome TaxID=652676 RepID=A0A1W1BL46_9ZZZZ